MIMMAISKMIRIPVIIIVIMAMMIISFECFEIDQQQLPLSYGSTFSHGDKMPDIPVNQLLIVGIPDSIKPLLMSPQPPPPPPTLTLSSLAQLFGPQALMLQMDKDIEHQNMDNSYPTSNMIDHSSSIQPTLSTSSLVQEIDQDDDKKISPKNDQLEKFSSKFQGFVAEMKIRWKIRPIDSGDDDNDRDHYNKQRFRRYRRRNRHHHHYHHHDDNDTFEPDELMIKKRTKRQSITDIGEIFNNMFRQAKTTATNGMAKMQRTIQTNSRRLFGNVLNNNNTNRIGESMGLSKLWSRIFNIYDQNINNRLRTVHNK
ncbi:uncharacterized protein LOC113790782 [Dermatophagoides pteronyssinus]|uniref:uncharacterized protein LOC113790782 n=1 Tax=Dermatophagoides pteronyssinus TaxID=6956 RepID=UPI003F673DAB